MVRKFHGLERDDDSASSSTFGTPFPFCAETLIHRSMRWVPHEDGKEKLWRERRLAAAAAAVAVGMSLREGTRGRGESSFAATIGEVTRSFTFVLVYLNVRKSKRGEEAESATH